jgi:hypothetical protein
VNRREVLHLAAEEAGVAAAGEALSAADFDFIGRRLDAKFAELAELGEVMFDLDATPQAYGLPLAQVVAGTLANGYGMDVAQAKALADEGMKSLRRLKAQPYFGGVTPATYY